MRKPANETSLAQALDHLGQHLVHAVDLPADGRKHHIDDPRAGIAGFVKRLHRVVHGRKWQRLEVAVAACAQLVISNASSSGR